MFKNSYKDIEFVPHHLHCHDIPISFYNCVARLCCCHDEIIKKQKLNNIRGINRNEYKRKKKVQLTPILNVKQILSIQ